MRSYNLAKYNVKSSLKSIIIYYLIFTVTITMIEMLNKSSGGNGYTSGVEFSSAIFLFVLGLNFFKENFYFTQANNISRTDYFKAVVIAILPIGLGMSIVDVIINRVHNLFAVSPTMYDMAYNQYFSLAGNDHWVQSNSLQTIFRTVIFLFAFYIAAFGIGLLITMIYYRCNKTMKILVSLSPVAFITIYGRIVYSNPEFAEKVVVFIDNIFGISTRNSYRSVITFVCLFLVSMLFVYMLVRKAVVKRV